MMGLVESVLNIVVEILPGPGALLLKGFLIRYFYLLRGIFQNVVACEWVRM